MKLPLTKSILQSIKILQKWIKILNGEPSRSSPLLHLLKIHFRILDFWRIIWRWNHFMILYQPLYFLLLHTLITERTLLMIHMNHICNGTVPFMRGFVRIKLTFWTFPIKESFAIQWHFVHIKIYSSLESRDKYVYSFENLINSLTFHSLPNKLNQLQWIPNKWDNPYYEYFHGYKPLLGNDVHLDNSTKLVLNYFLRLFQG